LLGKHFKIMTDHAALTWLRKTPDPIGQQARWLEQMEEFDFTVEHRPGLSHGNADGMSRRPCPNQDCCCGEKQRTVTNCGESVVQIKNDSGEITDNFISICAVRATIEENN